MADIDVRRLPERPGGPGRPPRHRDRADRGSGARRPSGPAGPDLENPNVTRIVLANLVVERPDGRRRRGSATVLDTVTTPLPLPDDRPAPDRRARAGRSPPRSRRSATCPRRACRRSASERIVLRAGPEAVDLLPGRGPPAAGGRPAVRALVDRRPPQRRGPVPRPGRRVLAADPRPARPRRRPRGAPPRARPGDLPATAATPPGSA